MRHSTENSEEPSATITFWVKIGSISMAWQLLDLLILIVARILSMRFAVCLLWLTAVGGGFAILLRYQNAGGAAGSTPSQWPSAAHIALDHNRPTMIMFAHPQCPCTRASMEELNRILAQCSGKVATHVLFFKPSGFSDGWVRTGLWPSAAAIPGVAVQEDGDGAQARLFGAETSGYLVLYDPQGRLLFKGGITGSRAHAGDNAGENAVVSLLTGHAADLTQTPVYGCSLLGECQASPTSLTK
jgi:hypothetical protein